MSDDKIVNDNNEFVLSFSKMRSFMKCEVGFFHRYIQKDIVSKPSEAMSCGALLDAVVTKGYNPFPSEAPSVSELTSVLSSPYGDGSDHVGNLLLKSGKFSTRAVRCINAALRLKAEPEVAELLKHGVCQKTYEGVFLGRKFSCTPDIVYSHNDKNVIADVKKTSSELEVWSEIMPGTVESHNRKLRWWDAWDYWMQLALYKHITNLLDAKTVLLAASEESPTRLEGVVLYTDIGDLEDTLGPKLDRMDHLISTNWEGATGCGVCEACRSLSSVNLNRLPTMPVNRYVNVAKYA